MNPLNAYPFFSGAKPRVIGHRGATGVAPENTLPSFQRAFDDGAEFVELDVWGSKDGHAVIIHDGTLGRTTNGGGRVTKRSLGELRELDAGYWFTSDSGLHYPYRGKKIAIATLEEHLRAFPRAKTIIEIKQSRPPITQKVVETICRLGKQDQVLLATEKDEIMKGLRKELEKNDLRIATGFSYGEVAYFFSWAAGGQRASFVPAGQAMQIPCEYQGMPLVSEATLKAAHNLGVEMWVWTVNDVEEMDRLLKLGVDGIITDYPSRLRNLMARP